MTGLIIIETKTFSVAADRMMDMSQCTKHLNDLWWWIWWHIDKVPGGVNDSGRGTANLLLTTVHSSPKVLETA
ncbi:MAG: hypothetical protein K2Z81_18435 [Cyanobacteria bacterium]|nr:hypothetical protein [Cyanobacteriota bacterium]